LFVTKYRQFNYSTQYKCKHCNSDAAITGWTEPAAGTLVTDATNNWNIQIPDAIAENSNEEGAVLFTATATTDATRITYTLLSSTGEVGVVNSETGVVTVGTTKTLDYEIETKYVFVIKYVYFLSFC